MKTCNKCGKEKKLDQFHNKHDSPDGHSTICAKCTNERFKRKPDETASELLTRAW